MAIINARSPYYVSITNNTISYATLEIYIWIGDKITDVPLTAQYSLKKYIQGTLTKVSFEISQLVRDDLDMLFNGDYDTSATSDGGAKWVKTTIKAFNSSNAQVGSTVTETNIAFDGYGYFEEGSSFTMANESLFTSEGDIFLPKFGDSNIAIYTGNNPTVLLKDIAGATVDTSSFTSSVQSSEQIKYVSLYPELVTNVGFDDAADWTIRTNDVIEDGLLKCGGQSGDRVNNAFTPVTGTNYILKFTITDYTSGWIGAYTGVGGVNLSGQLSEIGTYTYQYTQGTTTLNQVSFYTSSGFNGSIDNVSLKEVYDVSKISVTDSLSSELVTNGNFQTDTDWQKTPTATIGSGKASFIGSVGELSDIQQPSVFTIGNTYLVTIDAVVTSGLGIKVQEGGLGESIGVITSTGSYSFTFTSNFSSTLYIGRRNGGQPFNCSVDNVSVIQIKPDINTANVKQVEECKFKPHKVTFVNKNGVLDDMYFFKKSTDSMTTKRESYNANTIKADNTYSINQHNKREFNITANSMVKLSSGYLNESSNEKFKQLLLSEKVWITRTFKNDELVLPINIKTSSISYKTSLNDKLVDYTIEFKDSYNAINNIR